MWRCVLAMMATSCLSSFSLSSTAASASRLQVPCEEARLKCAYREGCGKALQNYLMGCSSVLQDATVRICPEICQHALIALTSTEEGKDLMTCECSDDFCADSKKRVEICRPQVVIANRNETVVSCRVAQWICGVDTMCSTALDYYNRYCRSMFHGKKCTNRCMNSISILRRQEKAAKLKTCKCDGYEDYDCFSIQANMARLCFHKKDMDNSISGGDTESNTILETNEVLVSVASLPSPTAASLLLLLAATLAAAIT